MSAWKRRRCLQTSGHALTRRSTPQPLAAAAQTSNPLLSQSLNRIYRESLKTQLRDHVRAVKGEIGFTATPSLPLNLGTVSSVTVCKCHKRGV